jgi:acyl-CoA reductase-like NAD-dependent aldehyde dehydrogenase
MLQIVQAYDRSPIEEVATDGADTLEAKLDLAARAFHDRDRWLKPHERIEVLYRLASPMEERRE